jgi:hypothetical protein
MTKVVFQRLDLRRKLEGPKQMEVDFKQPELRTELAAYKNGIKKGRQKWYCEGRLSIMGECLPLGRRLIEMKVYDI